MAYRKLGVTNKHRKSMLATLTKQLILNEKITTTVTRAKELRRVAEKLITQGKDGSLGARRRALAAVHNDKAVVEKAFTTLAERYANRNGGYTRILKLDERRGDDALMVIISLVNDDAKVEEVKETKKTKKETTK